MRLFCVIGLTLFVAAVARADNLGLFYDVWRGTTPDPGKAVPVASWLNKTEFNDAVPAPGTTNWYWVRAMKAEGFSYAQYVCGPVLLFTEINIFPTYAFPTTVKRGVSYPVLIQDRVWDRSQFLPVTLHDATYELKPNIFQAIYTTNWTEPIKNGSTYSFDHTSYLNYSQYEAIPGWSGSIDLKLSCHYSYSVPSYGDCHAAWDWGDYVTVRFVDQLPSGPSAAACVDDGCVRLTWTPAVTDTDFSSQGAPVGSDWLLTGSVAPSDGGSVMGAGWYADGVTALISAQPRNGFRFVSWSGADVAQSNSAATTVLMTNNASITANFIRTWPLQVSANPATGGTVLGGGWYDDGASATVTAVSAVGYVFLNWEGVGLADVYCPTTTVTMTAPLSVTARFAKLCALQVQAFPTNGGSAGDNGIYLGGTNVTIWAAPQSNWFFGGWVGGGDIADPGAMTTTVRLADSATVTAQFYNDQNGRIEYYIDHDPGTGNGTRVPFAPGSAVRADFLVPMTGLTYGVHTLFVRAQDVSSNWGQAFPITFTKDFNVAGDQFTQVETFYDQDPGLGQGQELWSGLATSVTVTNKFDVSTLPHGVHLLHIRGCDQRGNWGPAFPLLFDWEPMGGRGVDAVEYYVDTDPGAGNGNVWAFATTNETTIPLWVYLQGQRMGGHTLYVRGRSGNGSWGPPFPLLYSHEPECLVMPSTPLQEVRYSIVQAGTQFVGGSVFTNSAASTTTVSFAPNISSMHTTGTYDLHVTGVGPDGIPGPEGIVSFRIGGGTNAAYEAWKTNFFSATERTNSSVSGFLSDPDGDQLLNGAEYAFGTHPRQGTNACMPSMQLTNGYFQITYRERRGGAGTVGVFYTVQGLRYSVEVSTDLMTNAWRTSEDLVQQVGTAIDNGDGTETVTVRSIMPIDALAKMFMRLKLVLLGD